MRWWGFLITASTFVVGTVFPATKSVEALESKKYSDDAQWLTYWVMVALLAILERFAAPVIRFLPFYAEAKLALLCWLALPPFSGATLIYLNSRPLLVQGTLQLKTFWRQIRGVDDTQLKKEERYMHWRTRMATVENGVSASLAALYNDVLAGDGDEAALDKQLKKYESALPDKAAAHGDINLSTIVPETKFAPDAKRGQVTHRVRASVPNDQPQRQPEQPRSYAPQQQQAQPYAQQEQAQPYPVQHQGEYVQQQQPQEVQYQQQQHAAYNPDAVHTAGRDLLS